MQTLRKNQEWKTNAGDSLKNTRFEKTWMVTQLKNLPPGFIYDENESAGNSKFWNQMSEKGRERIKTCWLTGDYYTTSYSVGGSQIEIDLAVFQMCA